MPQTFYLDQNALIYAYQECIKNVAFKEELENCIKDGHITIVLSPWHWVETARTKDLAKALPLAAFMDFLRPAWLRDRRDLERTEVENEFFKFAKLSFQPKPPLISRVELLSALNNQSVSPDQAPSSRNFVENWITKPALMESIIASHRKNVEALNRVRSARASGKLTKAIKVEADQKLIAGFLPSTTPNGVQVDSQTKSTFLKAVTTDNFPTLAIESAIAEYSWANQGRLDWNSMIDKFHVISSLPYVDFLVSDDGYLSLLLMPAKSTGFAKATLIKFVEFCKKFPS